jgi:hypothetical protein
MWIINEDGFFSAVEDWDNDQFLYVRGRAESDLQAFVRTASSTTPKPAGWRPEIVNTPERDYEWRVHAPRSVWAQYLSTKASDISYGNFKDHCSDTWHKEHRDGTRQRLSVLHEAWFLFNRWPDNEL